MIEARLGEFLGRVCDSQSLWSDLNELCSFGGRFAGTESEHKAADFLKERLKSIAQLAVKYSRSPLLGLDT